MRLDHLLSKDKVENWLYYSVVKVKKTENLPGADASRGHTRSHSLRRREAVTIEDRDIEHDS